MECQRCGSDRLLNVSGKTSDRCIVEDIDGNILSSYVPIDIGIGGGDYIEFEYCLECGQIQDSFPVGDPEWEDIEDFDE